ncbi:MAG TPA: exodeoxyribonuclease VII small subunit [Thermomicrobiales bacterium]|nr:exodeoxyribonuclease VII small subunit [Thermomicrobiales bacterium]
MPDETTQMIDRWRSVSDDGSFEAALVALDEIVAFLETGQRGLDETIAAYEIGTAVASRCEVLLSHAELRVSRIAVEPRPSRPVRFVEDDPEDEDDDDDDPKDDDGGETPF